jgi:hypothetical protein
VDIENATNVKVYRGAFGASFVEFTTTKIQQNKITEGRWSPHAFPGLF